MGSKKSKTDQALFESVFGVASMQERFDRLAAVYIQERILPSEEPSESRDNAMNAIDVLLKESKGKGVIEVQYKKGANAKGMGRWFASGIAGMQRMPRRIRHTICQGLWLDLDFVNIHPTILSQLCATWDIQHRFLAKYVENREDVLNEMVQLGVSCREEAKETILKVLNGGKVNLDTVPWWKDMCLEFSNMAREVAMHVDNKAFQDCCLSAGKTSNFHAKVMNAVLCHHENRCLQQLYCFLAEKGCIEDGHCSLIFDGIMVQNTDFNAQCIRNKEFLCDATRFIQKATDFRLEIKLKDFSEAYDLPEGYRDTIFDMIIIDSGDDAKAADAFLERYSGQLVKCEGRVFWYANGTYTDNRTEVENGIETSLKRMKIYMKGSNGQLYNYSTNTKHLRDCMKLILSDDGTIRSNFVEELWYSNLRCLAFEDGVYSFEKGCFIPYPVEGVFFTYKINRKFPVNVHSGIRKELMERLLKPIMPDEEQLAYFLHCLARALAGEIYDKKWYVCIGERNSGKGVLCELSTSAFKHFVQTINSENLLYNR